MADQEGACQGRQDLRDRLERLIKPKHRALLVAFHGAADLAGDRRAQYAVAETGEQPGATGTTVVAEPKRWEPSRDTQPQKHPAQIVQSKQV